MPEIVFPDPKMKKRLARLREELLADAVPPYVTVTQGSMAAALQEAECGEPNIPTQEEPVRRSWKVDIVMWLRNLVQLEDGRSPSPSAGEENLEPSPFRWEPQRAGINVPLRSGPPLSKAIDPRRSSRGIKIPIRPLHKQPFYRRFLFYLRRWLSSSLWQESDPAA